MLTTALGVPENSSIITTSTTALPICQPVLNTAAGRQLLCPVTVRRSKAVVVVGHHHDNIATTGGDVVAEQSIGIVRLSCKNLFVSLIASSAVDSLQAQALAQAWHGISKECHNFVPALCGSPIVMSAGELESGNAGEPAQLIRQRYREASDVIKKGKMCCLFINDLDAGAGRMGGTTQYTVNNQMVNATLMNIADNPTNVQLPGM